MFRFWLVVWVTVIGRDRLVFGVDEGQFGCEDKVAVQVRTMKNTMQVLSDQWEKWNTLFVTSLEPRITSTASTLSSIDSNIHNLQERAHVWDTFQLHVAAWNDQLASMDRKIDILNKAVEQFTVLDTKLNTILSEEYKLDKLIKLSSSLLESLLNVEDKLKSKQFCKSSGDSLFEEFAARGILSSLKLVERKVDQLLSTRQNENIKPPVNDELSVKYAVSKSMENVVNDISAKVDIIFDSVSKVNENDYSDEYIDAKDVEGSGSNPSTQGISLQKHRPRGLCKSLNQGIKGLGEIVSNVDKNLVIALNKINQHIASTENAPNSIVNSLKQFSKTISDGQSKNVNSILKNYFQKERAYWLSTINNLSQKCLKVSSDFPTTETVKTVEVSTELFKDDSNSVTESTSTSYHYKSFIEEIDTQLPRTTNKASCTDLDMDSPSGVYVFKNSPDDFINERFFNKQFCELRDNGLWIVIQRRGNYSRQQDFNVSWYDYKLGFGDLQEDFWIGNNYLARLSGNNNLTLRIELEDFEGHNVWAEYRTFRIADENEYFRLSIGGYSGNASDAFSSHSGSFFSTFDQKHDEAPDCCPCSVSYGGGWWFNKCFESNLNGVYYKKPFTNDYYRGIIWEHWLGNYSLKKSQMMVKPTGSTQFYSKYNLEEP